MAGAELYLGADSCYLKVTGILPEYPTPFFGQWSTHQRTLSVGASPRGLESFVLLLIRLMHISATQRQVAESRSGLSLHFEISLDSMNASTSISKPHPAC
jgi:hypothetical protein